MLLPVVLCTTITRNYIIDTPYEVVYINVEIEDKMTTTSIPTGTSVPTGGFDKDDKLLNYAWSNNEKQSKTPYDSSYRVILLDGDVDQQEVQHYKDLGHIVIGYLSVGSWENWRDDKDDFSDRVVGQKMGNWAGEYWFNLEFWEDLKVPMTARFQTLLDKGFDGYEGDNIGMIEQSNNKGREADNIEYGKWLGTTAKNMGLLSIMKNGFQENNIVPDLVDYYDALIFEEAFRYNEVDAYISFKDKPVWGFEYNRKSKIQTIVDENTYPWVSHVYYQTSNGWEEIN